MRASPLILVSTLGGLLVAGAGVLGMDQLAGGELGTMLGFAPIRQAQLRPTTPRPDTAPPASAAPAAPAAPQRVETTAYDSWIVTCEDTVAGGMAKRACVASLRPDEPGSSAAAKLADRVQ